MAMTKVQIANEVLRQNGFTMKHSAEIVEDVLELIKKTLESGEDVLISNFGKFRKRGQKKGSTIDLSVLSSLKHVTPVEQALVQEASAFIMRH